MDIATTTANFKQSLKNTQQETLIKFTSHNPILQNLQAVLDTSNIPTFVTGDFNGWHKNWGSNQNNSRGKILEKFITQSNYILLNDMSATHFSTHNTLTNVDLTFSSPILQTTAHGKQKIICLAATTSP